MRSEGGLSNKVVFFNSESGVASTTECAFTCNIVGYGVRGIVDLLIASLECDLADANVLSAVFACNSEDTTEFSDRNIPLVDGSSGEALVVDKYCLATPLSAVKETSELDAKCLRSCDVVFPNTIDDLDV